LIITLGASFVTSAGAMAQSSASTSLALPTVRTADDLHAEAISLHGDLKRSVESAMLHVRSALERPTNDPQAIACLRLAANLFWGQNRPLDARWAMEQAAQRAVAAGNLFMAAQSYLDAAFITREQGQQAETIRLATEARRLAESAGLDESQRKAIMSRIRIYPVAAR
jgi:ATP/maltotriose-dependent transcriptional regulator MalT